MARKEIVALPHMLVAIVAMFLQQTCGSVGRVLPAVLAPLIILELHADPSWVGVYFGLTAVAALIGQLGSGGFIIRHGAIRMSQAALLSVGGGMAVAVVGGAAGFVLSALIGNGVAAVATPASSQLLGRWAVRRYAPFAFSITQTAIPAGILLAGSFGPLLAQSLGWRGTMLVSAAACWLFALLLQPLHGRLDTEATPTHAIHLSDFRTTITGVLATRELRALSCACFAFNGMQAVFIAYFVTWLTALGYNLVAAGSLFATVIAIAIPCRILWGWIGSFYIAPRLMMAVLAFGMAASIVLVGAFTTAWPPLAIATATGVVSATAMSWHGILLSESARLAPPGRAGPVTGGVLSFGQMGAILCPSMFALLLRVTGGYAAGWEACAIPALLVGMDLLRGTKVLLAGPTAHETPVTSQRLTPTAERPDSRLRDSHKRSTRIQSPACQFVAEGTAGPGNHDHPDGTHRGGASGIHVEGRRPGTAPSGHCAGSGEAI